MKQQICDMAVNGSGIRDRAGVLKISPTTVIEALKKDRHLEPVNRPLLEQLKPTDVGIAKHVEEAEARCGALPTPRSRSVVCGTRTLRGAKLVIIKQDKCWGRCSQTTKTKRWSS